MFFALLGVAVIVVVLAGSAMSLFLGVPGARSGTSSGAPSGASSGNQGPAASPEASR
jgi:hypothetical protein